MEAPEWSLLSTVALLLRANVPRGVQIKGSIDYPNSFTGKDVVSTLQELLISEAVGSRHALVVSGDQSGVRQVALSLAKSLKNQLFFHEVDWGENELTDDVDEVYTFLEDSLADPGSAPDDPDDWAAALNHNSAFDVNLQLSVGGVNGGSGAGPRRNKPTNRGMADLDELPNGVFTPLTKCYSPLCGSGRYVCYSPSCPNSATSPLRMTVTDSGSRSNKLGGGLDGGLSTVQIRRKHGPRSSLQSCSRAFHRPRSPVKTPFSRLYRRRKSSWQIWSCLTLYSSKVCKGQAMLVILHRCPLSRAR